MILISDWTAAFTQRLQRTFGSALLFAGLQGSYGRGEATMDSDIDMVVVLEAVGTEELRLYREAVAAMPNAGKACGFLCSRDALKSWPGYDRLFLYLDTTPLLGRLENIAPVPDAACAAEAVRIGASALYHAVCHEALYGEIPDRNLPDLRKAAFFVLRARHYRRTGCFVRARRALFPLLEAEEQALLDDNLTSEETRNRLLCWCEACMRE